MKERSAFPPSHSGVARHLRARLLVLLVCLSIIALGVWFAARTAEAGAHDHGAKRRAARASAKTRHARRASRRKPSERFKSPLLEPAREDEGEDPEGRANWFYAKRAYPFAQIPWDARRRAWDARPVLKGRNNSALAAQQVWTPIGPAPTDSGFANNWGLTSGRINAVAVSPADPQLVLVGASTGGIWRSTNGGESFAPVSDNHVDLAVGEIAFAPSNPSIVYAGMGDIDGSYLGTGVLRSTDGGQTWARASNHTLPAPGLSMDIVVSPTDPNRVYAAQAASLNTATGIISVSGLYFSTDGGVNWTKTLSGNARDLAFHPSNPQTLYAAMRTVEGITPGVYKSTDGGQTWSLAYTSPYGLNTRDIRVSVSAADPQRVYLYAGGRLPTGTNTEVRVEVSTDAGATWTNRGGSGIDPGQFGYNTYFHASPADANTLYVGARDVYKSTDGGQTWTNLTRNFHAPEFRYNPTLSSAHPDQQSFAFSPGAPDTVYVGNDGGLYKTTNGGQTFQSLNQSLSLTQFVGLSVHPTDPNISYGGTQDNGTQRRLEGTSRWKEFSGGDGGRTVINPADPGMVFTTYIYGNVYRHTNNGTTFTGTMAANSTFGEPSNGQRIAFYPPFTGNGVDNKLYFGTYRLFICQNCDDPTKSLIGGNAPNWVAPGGTFDQTRGSFDVLTAIGVARSDTRVIYTGSAQGRAMVSNDGGATWSDISNGRGLPNRFIESITVHPDNPSVAYLTVSGYNTGHVFKTVNMGATWTDVSGNLPDIPTSAFLFDPTDPNTVYAGTDIGVFRSTAGGTTWESFNTGMPPVVVTAFAAQPGGRIQVATYGRGAYEMAAGGTPPPPSTFSFASAGASVSEGGGKVRVTVNRTDSTVAAAVRYATSDGTATDIKDYTAAAGTLRFNPGEPSKSFDVFVTDDAFAEPSETFNVTLSDATGATLGEQTSFNVTLADDDTTTGPSPVRNENFDSEFFVWQHYIDFLNREPDASGLAFWKGQIDECESRPAPERQGCREVRRINVSAAFFLSIEFQETGYLVYRFHQTAYNTGERLRVRDFVPDAQEVGRGVRIGEPGANALLEANKLAYANAFVARPEFLARYPLTLTNFQFVAALNQNTGGSLTQGEFDDILNRMNAGQMNRAQALRAIATNAEFSRQHLNRAFVYMEYVGYMRRDPDAEGFGFWLKKLLEHNGNYVEAEMVKAFITSGEYIARFGQP